MLSRDLRRQTHVVVGILTQVAALLIGVPLGIVAGYAGGVFDWIVTPG
jgi:ABC-type dipeptide/oligopeptide/nickel transport system permease subunit